MVETDTHEQNKHNVDDEHSSNVNYESNSTYEGKKSNGTVYDAEEIINNSSKDDNVSIKDERIELNKKLLSHLRYNDKNKNASKNPISQVKDSLYDFISKNTSIDLYKRAILKDLKNKESQANNHKKEIDRVFDHLYGGISYVPLGQNESMVNFMRRINRIPKNKISLSFKKEYFGELLSSAMHDYETSLKLIDDYDNSIIKLTSKKRMSSEDRVILRDLKSSLSKEKINLKKGESILRKYETRFKLVDDEFRSTSIAYSKLESNYNNLNMSIESLKYKYDSASSSSSLKDLLFDSKGLLNDAMKYSDLESTVNESLLDVLDQFDSDSELSDSIKDTSYSDKINERYDKNESKSSFNIEEFKNKMRDSGLDLY